MNKRIEAKLYNQKAAPLLNQKKYEAKRLLSRAIQLDPALGESYYLLGVIYHLEMKWDQALIYYQRALQMTPELTEAYLVIGAILLGKGRYKEAIDCFTKGGAAISNSTTCYINWGSAYFRMGHYEEAILKYMEAIEIDPNCSSAFIEMGTALIQQEKYERALMCFEKALEIDPNRDFDPIHIANTIRGYKRSSKKSKQNGIEKKTSLLAFLAKNAKKEFNKGDLKVAEVICDSMIQLDPSSSEAYNLLGVLYSCKVFGYYKALKTYKKAIQCNPDMPDPYNNMGLLLVENKKYHQAIECYQKAITLMPRLESIHNNLGLVYYYLGRYQEAIMEFMEAIEINANCSSAFMHMGTALSKQNRYDRALLCFEKALEIDPNGELDPIHFNRAITEYKRSSRKGNLNGIEKKTNLLAFLAKTAKKEFSNDHFNVAEVICDSMLQLDPSSSEAYNLLGLIYSQ